MGRSRRHLIAVSLLCSAWLLSACGGGNSNATPATYSIGGMVSGLYAGAPLALLNNGSDKITVTASGSFSFPTSVPSGGSYAVTVAAQPLAQVCTVSAGTGSGVTSSVSSVRIACSPATESVLHSFNVNPDIQHPGVSVIQAGDGNFYGTSQYGGINGLGTVYKISPAGIETVLYSFAGGTQDGSLPMAALVQGSDGNFYGTAHSGGANGCGAVFKITPAGIETVLYSFAGDTAAYSVGGTTDGCFPSGALVQGRDGNFYGTTSYGGTSNSGTVYTLTPSGLETVLHSFSGGPDGFAPVSALVLGTDGNFYGTTPGGGTSGNGTVFKITPLGAKTVIYSFAGAPADGAQPLAALIQATDGNFYGTTANGGASGNGSAGSGVGTVFKITSGGAETLLYSFANGPVGNQPAAALIQGADGNFYGTTSGGATIGQVSISTGNGMIFKITPLGAETVIHSFAGAPADGSQALAALIQGTDGNFYCTTSHGGASDSGSFVKITPAGLETLIYSFNSAPEGQHPVGLIPGKDGNFYGTTASGGTAGDGTVFKITSSGVETVLYSFQGGSDGSGPEAALVQGSDGNFYGTTAGGGTTGNGTVFKMTPSGVETVLYSFQAGSDGSGPEAALVQGSDGNFYGTTVRGGATAQGALFRITPSGIETVLHSFAGGTSDGNFPFGALIQGSDGNFYGTTLQGGANNDGGTVYKMTPAGIETVLYSFNGGTTESGPAGALIEGGDGNFYGTTAVGIGQGGTVFKITPDGVFTALYVFQAGADEIYPSGALIQGGDGNFYGTAQWWDGNDADSPRNGAIFMVTPTGAETTIHSFTGGTQGSLPNSLILGDGGIFYGTTYYGGDSGQGTVFTF